MSTFPNLIDPRFKFPWDLYDSSQAIYNPRYSCSKNEADSNHLWEWCRECKSICMAHHTEDARAYIVCITYNTHSMVNFKSSVCVLNPSPTPSSYLHTNNNNWCQPNNFYAPSIMLSLYHLFLRTFFTSILDIKPLCFSFTTLHSLLL